MSQAHRVRAARARGKGRNVAGVIQPSAESRKRQPSQGMRAGIAVGILCGLVLIAYTNGLRNGFVWDDNRQIVLNPDLRAGAQWTTLFSSDVWGYTHHDQRAQTNYYRPLQMAAYRLTSGLFGLDPQPLHILSVVFALAAVLAAFMVYLKLTGRLAIAFVAAALFAVHPVHSEAVDWISALPEIGCAIFIFAAFGLFLSIGCHGSDVGATAESHAGRWVLWCLSLLMFAGALLWKETAIVFPAIIAAYVVCFRPGNIGQRLRSSAKLSLPFWCVLAAYLALRFRILGFLAMRQRMWDLTPVQVGLSVFHLMLLYWWKLIVPVDLNAYYVFSPVRSILEMRAISGILFAVLSCAAICYGLRRAPLAAFAALWVFITLLPVMNIYAVGRNVFAERYLYVPSFGFCLLAVLIADLAMRRLPERGGKTGSALLFVAVLAWFSLETFARNSDWHDDATLFRKTLILSPNAPFVYFMVASTESDDPGAAQSAEVHYLKAIELAERESPPDFLDLARTYEGLSSLYADRGDYDHALEILQRWRTVIPNQPQADAEEGLILLRLRKWHEAEPLLNRALAARPQDENVLNALGLLAWEYTRNLDHAVQFFMRALAIHTAKDDFQASLHNNLGGVYADLGQFPSAIAQFQSAVAISPGDAEYHTNLATALAATERYDEAAAEANSALRILPDYAPARTLLQQLDGRVVHER
jgi:protein O-mannosyl-transferase